MRGISIKTGNNNKGFLSVSAIYISSIIGAGFATGQEINSFFSRYGVYSFIGLALILLLFSVCGALLLRKIHILKVNSLDELLSHLGIPAAAFIIKSLAYIFQFIVFVVMQAGMRTILEENGVPKAVAVIIVSILVIIIVSTDINRLMAVNSFLTPIVIIGMLILFIFLIAVYKGDTSSVSVIVPKGGLCLASAFLYFSFNMLLSLPALCEISAKIDSKKNAVKGGLVGGFVIFLLALGANLALLLYNNISASELPIVQLSYNLGNISGYGYTAVVFIAMLTSCTICGFCIAKKCAETINKKQLVVSALICLLAVPLAMIDFSKLISTLYPAFGMVGVLAVIFILFFT